VEWAAGCGEMFRGVGKMLGGGGLLTDAGSAAGGASYS